LFPFYDILPHPMDKSDCMWPWPGLFLVGMAGLAILMYVGTNATWAAWGMLWGFYWVLLALDACWANEKSLLRRWGLRVVLLGLSGCVPVVIAQVESRFSDEEFFVILQALGMSLCWALLLWGRTWVISARMNCICLDRSPVRSMSHAESHGLCLPRRWLVVGGFVVSLLGAFGTVRAYQNSFYPASAPSYPGITLETPFLCGQVSPASQTFDGEDVFRRLLARIEANPYKGPPDYGILALGTGEMKWAIAFREHLLGEAAARRFTGPAHSVKWIQYEAALRVYYFARVAEAFPDLFSQEARTVLREWFADINRRALTVEWVDWMYALAFAKGPEGPYENQENGAGLLALLEAEDLTSPGLSPLNRDYLARCSKGWEARFRNTDDAFIYQMEWINNAYFQSLYFGEPPIEQMRRSFDWLMLQALPDAAPLTYNSPMAMSLAGIAYWGADLLEDPRYLWLAGRALDNLEAEGGYLAAQPGVEHALSMVGRSPKWGSCLLYGDSGLPTQVGPLAPDKVVLRDGWSEKAVYMLLNLRFTGWHRYKATNALTLVYRGTPLVEARLEGPSFSWLPEGRSLFRDKRVPRENLNAFLVERTGMPAVLYALMGIGGPWAQDPPYYAEVLAFETGETVDWVQTRLTAWRGWQHDRWIYLYHGGGPIVVVDVAQGDRGKAAFVWHPAGQSEMENARLKLGPVSGEVRWLPWDDKGSLIQEGLSDARAGSNIIYQTSDGGPLRLITVFLLDDWEDAHVALEDGRLRLRTSEKEIRLVLPPVQD
jgi:hypothetical protein